MTRKKLENLARIGQLHTQPWSQRDFEGLLTSGIARLQDAKRPELSLEGRFDLAYNAAHALSLAALRWLHIPAPTKNNRGRETAPTRSTRKPETCFLCGRCILRRLPLIGVAPNVPVVPESR